MISKTEAKKLDDVRVHATVFEDNQSCYQLAVNQKISSRTRWIQNSMHWFWAQVNDPTDGFTIVKCPSSEMKADYLTKPLPRATFEYIRQLVQGW